MSLQTPPASGSAPVLAGASTSTMAVVSLVAGILGLSLLPFIGSIVAVITGPIAKRDIAASGGAANGRGTGHGRSDPRMGGNRPDGHRRVHHRRGCPLAPLPGPRDLERR